MDKKDFLHYNLFIIFLKKGGVFMAKKSTNNLDYGVQKQQLNNLSKSDFIALRNLSYLTRNIYNVALYSVRQHFFETKEFLNYENNYHKVKSNENYTLLNKNSAQLTIKKVQNDFKSFFELLKLKKKGLYNEKVKIPKYLKEDRYYNILFQEFSIRNGVFSVPMTPQMKKLYGKVNIKVPSNLLDKKIKEIRIIPKHNARFFEIQYVYERNEKTYSFDKQYVYEIPELQKDKNLNEELALAIDLGIDNLCTCTTNNGDAFIIDGKKLKSINQFANKKNAFLQSIKDKQNIKKTTKKQSKLWSKRNNQVNYYLSKAARIIINYCIQNQIGNIVLGYSDSFQKETNLGKANNQNFVNIPLGELKKKLEYLCKWNGINLIIQEESYTSKSSFLDKDDLPIYDEKSQTSYSFSGKRIKRGLYKSKSGIILNADVNGSLNILRKTEKFSIQLISIEYLSPKRIRIF